MIPVYIAHEYGGIDANRPKAAEFAAVAALCGYLPMCSWIVLTGVLPETEDNRELGLQLDCAQIDLSRQLWLCGPRLSSGMIRERNHASLRKYSQSPIRERDFIGKSPAEVTELLVREIL